MIRSDTRLVVLHMSVLDHSGKLITNLPKENFKVFENNAEQQVSVFKREDVPVSMGLVVDNSGSMRDKRQQVETAAIQLVKSSNKLDETFIVNFNDDAYLDVPFTNDISKMEEGIARIDSKGGTAMRDAVSMSVDYVKAQGKKDKKVLLVITDGNDTTSMGITLEKLVEKAHKFQDVLIYAIGILGEEDKREAGKAKRALDALTKASGGFSLYPKDLGEVESMAQQIARDIRNQYVLGYTPLNQNLDGTFRQIKVTAGKYTVRTRTGYYATPEAQKKSAAASTSGELICAID
ncbi:MAG: VWA domain-containing protein [Acidobacteriota bacterium]|nr:VWA domain-containing protein [Acidobacteriota bacterium]